MYPWYRLFFASKHSFYVVSFEYIFRPQSSLSSKSYSTNTYKFCYSSEKTSTSWPLRLSNSRPDSNRTSITTPSTIHITSAHLQCRLLLLLETSPLSPPSVASILALQSQLLSGHQNFTTYIKHHIWRVRTTSRPCLSKFPQRSWSLTLKPSCTKVSPSQPSFNTG